MDCGKEAPDSPVYTGSCMNQRSFEDDESWASLQSTILAGQLSMVDEAVVTTSDNPCKKNLPTVEEEIDETSNNLLDMNIDAISDDEVFYDCTNPNPVQDHIPSERSKPENIATTATAVGTSCASKIHSTSPLASAASSALVTGQQQQTISSTKLSTTSSLFKSCEPLYSDSGIGDDKTGVHLVHMIEDMRQHAQSTPKLDDVDFLSILTNAATRSSSIYTNLTECRSDTCVNAAVGSIANEDKESACSNVGFESGSTSLHSASTLMVGGPRTRNRLAATSSTSAIGMEVDSLNNVSTSVSASNSINSSENDSNSNSKSSNNSGTVSKPRRHVGFNTSRKSRIGSSSSAKLSVSNLSIHNQLSSNSSIGSSSNSSLHPCSSKSSLRSCSSKSSLRPCSSSNSIASSSISASSSRHQTSPRISNSSCSPVSNRLPKSPYVTKRRYGPPRRKVVPQLANFFETLSRVSSSGSTASTRTSERLNQSRASSTASRGSTRKIVFRVLPETKLRRSSPRKPVRKALPATPWKPRQEEQQQQQQKELIETPASKLTAGQLSLTTRSKIPVHIESARKRAARSNSMSSGSGTSVSGVPVKSRPVGGKGLAVRDANLIADAAARLKPVNGVPIKQRLMSTNNSNLSRTGRTPRKASPRQSPSTKNQSSIVTRRSVGLVTTPVRPVKQLRRIFSPAASTKGKSPLKRGVNAKRPKPNERSVTQRTNNNNVIQNQSRNKPIPPSKPVVIPRIVILQD